MAETTVVLEPGGFHFADGDVRMRTLLGSCVSITLWHPRLRIGGMCHYVVPSRGWLPAAPELDGRYADEAVEMFLSELRRRRTAPAEYVVKMFGGGYQFEWDTHSSAIDIPADNVATGRRLLEQHGFTLSAEHLGGRGHRQLVFELASGDVWLKHVSTTTGATR